MEFVLFDRVYFAKQNKSGEPIGVVALIRYTKYY